MSLPRNNLSEEVAQRLQAQLAAQQYGVGDKLPTEPDLMKEFGVGRSTIREAVRLLVSSGLVRVQQGVGTFILAQRATTEPLAKRLLRESAQDVREVRELLERSIVEKAALHRTQEDLAKLRQLLDARNAASRQQLTAEAIEADLRFHGSIADASKNLVLSNLYKEFSSHQLKQAFTLTFTDTSSLEQTIALHEGLLQSISDQDAAQAVAFAQQIHANSI